MQPVFIQKFLSLLPPHPDNGKDMVLWSASATGRFTVSSAYLVVKGLAPLSQGTRWSRIWKIAVPERVRTFIWLMMHERLFTNQRRSRMGLGDSDCPHCVSVVEDSLHVLRDCPLAVSVWNVLVNATARSRFFFDDLQGWIDFNIMSGCLGWDQNSDWSVIWAMTCYLLWSWRNKERHEANFIRPLFPDRVVLQYVDTYQQASERRVVHDGRHYQWTQVRWTPPSIGWVCVNTDGAAYLHGDVAGCGGLLRDHEGKWLGGFSRNLGSCHAFMAELWGVLDGLQLRV